MREGWTYKKLGDYIKEYSVKNKAGKDIPVYSVTNSQGFCKEYFSKEIASQDKTSYKIVPYGFFAFNPSRINVGSIDWQHKEEQVIVSPLYNVFSVSESVLQPYLLYYLKSPATIKYIDAIATGTVRLNLKLSMLKDFSIPLPSLSEQQAIVSELDKINELISLKKAQLSDLDALAQSIFYDMFGDPIENEKGWEVKKLEDVCETITDGDHMPPPKSENGIPFITISDINKETRKIDFNNTFYVPQEYYDGLKEERKAQINDLLYTVTGSYGIPVVVKSNMPFCFQRHIALIRPIQEKVLTIFLCYWVLCPSVKGEADRVATGIAQKTVGLNSIRQFDIILPPLPLQQEFAKRIELIEQQKVQISSTIKDLETLLASRMQYWFD